MPLVRIDVVEGRSDEDLRALADTVHGVMLDVFAAPPGDRYQVITEHRTGHLVLEDTGLGFTRTDDVVLVQVFQQGRSTEQKRALYRTLADRLQERHGIAPTDVMVSITGNSREDWSFAYGRAQFLEGDL